MKKFNCINTVLDKIGLISDTHDEMELTRKALDIFRENGVKTVLHAGDVIKPEMLDLFRGFDLFLVFGNGDDKEKITRACLENNFHPPQEYYCLSCKKNNIFLFHGHTDQVPLFRELCSEKKISYIVKGHTHIREDYRKNRIRIINPGFINRNFVSSCAILYLQEQKVDFFDIPNPNI